jgi:hypothetical protein
MNCCAGTFFDRTGAKRGWIDVLPRGRLMVPRLGSPEWESGAWIPANHATATFFPAGGFAELQTVETEAAFAERLLGSGEIAFHDTHSNFPIFSHQSFSARRTDRASLSTYRNWWTLPRGRGTVSEGAGKPWRSNQCRERQRAVDQ